MSSALWGNAWISVLRWTFSLVLINDLKEEINSSGMKLPTANRMGETARKQRNTANRKKHAVRKHKKLKFNLGTKMATCCLWKIITWLTYTQQGGAQVQILRRWEYRGRADECHQRAHPGPQRYPSSQLTLLFREVGTSVLPRNQSRGTASPTRGH